MKKLILFALALLSALCAASCDKNSGGGSESGGAIDDGKQFYSASGGAYADGRLYFISDMHLMYQNLDGGEPAILCYDPLCSHGYRSAGGIDGSTDCPAYIGNGHEFLIREKDGGALIYYVYTTVKDMETVYQLRMLDVSAMRVSVLCETGGKDIYKFWLYGDTLYLRVNSGEHNMDVGTIYDLYSLPDTGGKAKPVLSGGGDSPILFDAYGGRIYWRYISGNEIYSSTPDFKETKTVLSGVASVSAMYKGYIYYFKPEGDAVLVESEQVDAEYDPNFSMVGPWKIQPWNLYRQKAEEGSQPELVYTGSVLPIISGPDGSANYYIDRETGTFYLSPLDPVYKGYVLWQETNMSPAAAEQLGLTDTNILTCIKCDSNGRIDAVDLDTLETREVYSGLDGDIFAIYGATGGKLAVKYTLKDADLLREYKKSGATADSALNYYITAFLELK